MLLPELSVTNSPRAGSSATKMSGATRELPAGMVNCRSGDFLLKSNNGRTVGSIEVEMLFSISRLLPLGDRIATEFTEERHGRDSEPWLGMDEIYRSGNDLAGDLWLSLASRPNHRR